MDLSISRGEAKTLVIWLLILSIFMLICIFLKINLYDPISEKLKYENAQYEVVKDSSVYYTAITPITTFYDYIGNENVEGIMSVLNADYVKENLVTTKTIKDKKLFGLGTPMRYNFERMCKKDLAPGKASFVVAGDEYTDYFEGKPEYVDRKFYNIIMDENTFTFDIQPMSQEEYAEVCDGR